MSDTVSKQLTLDQRVLLIENSINNLAQETVKLQNILTQFFVNTTNLGLSSKLTNINMEKPAETPPVENVPQETIPQETVNTDERCNDDIPGEEVSNQI